MTAGGGSVGSYFYLRASSSSSEVHGVSDFVLETPVVPAETWCPECSGPPISERASLEYCRDHMPVTRGEADSQSNFGTVASWLSDAGGIGNQNMCNMIHRKEDPQCPAS